MEIAVFALDFAFLNNASARGQVALDQAEIDILPFRNRLSRGESALATIIVTFFLATCSVGCTGGISPPPNIRPQQPNVVSLDPQNWFTFYSGGMPSHPSSDPNAAWSFEIPVAGGHVNYVQTPFNATMVLHNVTITFRVESESPEYVVRDPGDTLPATLHVFFEQQNDDLSQPNGRWWAQPSKYDLGSQDNTTITFVVPLTPDLWTNVIGQSDEQAFSAALENVGWIGITFGGQRFFGHGVALAGGHARYVLADFQVN